MIIFVHMLKAGGTSLRELLQPIYGDRLLRDYDDIPMSNRPEHAADRERRRAEVRQDGANLDADIVYGHFIMDKYRGVRPDLQFGTMFRDPAERIVSHYFHYLRNIGGPRNEILPEGITLLEFARLPKYCDMYRYLLGAMSVADLDYVGITEEFDASVALFFRIFGVTPVGPVPRRADIRLNRASEYGDAHAYLEDANVLDAVRASQAPNYEVYDQAKERFRSLCVQYGVER